MANGPTGLGGPVTAAVTGFDTGLRTARPDIPKMTAKERAEHIQLIAGLRENIMQLKMEAIESFAQIATLESRVLGDIIVGYQDARAIGDTSRATVLASRSGELKTLIESLADPEPKIRNKLIEPQQQLSTNIAAQIQASPQLKQALTDKTITAEQLVDFTLTNLNNAAAGDSGKSEISKIRVLLDNSIPDASGPRERGVMKDVARMSAEQGIQSGIQAIAQQAGLSPADVSSAYLNRRSDINKLIGIEPQTAAELEASEEEKDKTIEQITTIRNDLENFGVSVGSLDYFLGKAKTATVGDLVSGGVSGLFNDLNDKVVAPESARFIKTLEDELEADTSRLDRFQRSMASYNSISGVVEARRALGLQDNYQFGFYVTNNPQSFNDAVLAVRNSNAQTQDQANEAIAEMLADGDEIIAQRLANNPRRMKRRLRRQGQPQGAISAFVEGVETRKEEKASEKLDEAQAQEAKQAEAEESFRVRTSAEAIAPTDFTKEQIEVQVQQIISKFPNLKANQVTRDLTKLNDLSKIAGGADAEAAAKAQREIAMRLGGATKLGPSKSGEYAAFVIDALGTRTQAKQNIVSMNQNLRQVRNGKIISAFDSLGGSFEMTPTKEAKLMKAIDPLEQQITNIAQGVQTQISGNAMGNVEQTGITTDETPSAAGAPPKPKVESPPKIGGATPQGDELRAIVGDMKPAAKLQDFTERQRRILSTLDEKGLAYNQANIVMTARSMGDKVPAREAKKLVEKAKQQEELRKNQRPILNASSTEISKTF